MIIYNPVSDRYELYSPAVFRYGCKPKYLRGLFTNQFAAWVALNHTSAASMAHGA